MTAAKTRQAAEILVTARRTDTLLDDLPVELRPETLEEAYEIQYEIASAFGSIGGWKVGLPKAGEAPRATPIPGIYVIPSGGRWPAAGPTRIEVELAVRMAKALPMRTRPYGRDDVLGAIASAHVAFELLGARFRDRKIVSSLTLLADGQSNGGLVVGAPIPGWAELDLSTLEMTLSVNGALEGSAAVGPSFEHTVEALVWLANHAAEHVGGLQEGQVILTGARIGPTTVATRRHIKAQAGDANVSATLG